MKHEPVIHVVAFPLLSNLKFIGLIIKSHWDIKCDFPQNLSVFFKDVSVKVTWKLPIHKVISDVDHRHWSLCVLKIQTQGL